MLRLLALSLVSEKAVLRQRSIVLELFQYLYDMMDKRFKSIRILDKNRLSKGIIIKVFRYNRFNEWSIKVLTKVCDKQNFYNKCIVFLMFDSLR